jgi:DNA-binding beta-propeller fold protein YncE
MSRYRKLTVFLVLCAGFVVVWRNYIIVIGQSRPAAVLAVLNKAESTLAIIDANGMKVVGKVPTGDSPHEVVLSPDGRTSFVANYGAQTPGSTLSVIDIGTAKETQRVDLSPLLRPHGLQMLGGKVYFTSEVNRLIGRYDPVAGKVDWLMGTGQNASHMIAITPDEKRFFTANIASDSITAFEFQSAPPGPSRITHIAVGRQPEAIDTAPDGREVWVGLNGEGAIDIVDVAAGKVKEKLKLGARPYRVRFTSDGRYVLITVPTTGELIVMEASTRRELKRVKVGGSPLGVAFTPDNKTVFISVVEPNAVVRVDLENFAVTGTVDSGNGPDGIAYFGN